MIQPSETDVIAEPYQRSMIMIFSLFLGKFFLYLAGITLIISGLTFLLTGNLHNNPLVFLFSLALASGITGLEFRNHFEKAPRNLLILLLLSFIIFITTTIVTGKIYDKSWDGMAYHQLGIMELSKGWNPFYEKLPDQPVESNYLRKSVNLNLYVNHYGKGLEIFSAALMSVTGNIESGKVLHILLFLSAFCFALYTLLQLSQSKPLLILAVALIAALNPITVNQMFSFYIDSIVASMFLIIVTQLTLLFHSEIRKENQLPALVSLFFAIIIMVNIKFTGVIYLTWVCAVYAILLLYLGMSRLLLRSLAVASFAGIVAICIAGVNPYITNSINEGHPFYPIAGKNKVDVIINMMPTPLEDANRIEKFLMSTFSSTNNSPRTREQTIPYKIPFTFSIAELKTLMSEAVRLGGFGVLWSGILCVTIPVFLWLLFRLEKRKRVLLIALTIAIVGSVLINPVAWWARFVPQLWLFPVIVILFLLHTPTLKRLLPVGLGLGVLLFINSMLVAIPYTYSVYASTTTANRIFTQMKASRKTVHAYFDIFTPNALKLENKKIPYIAADRITDLPCKKTEETLKIQFCEAK